MGQAEAGWPGNGGNRWHDRPRRHRGHHRERPDDSQVSVRVIFRCQATTLLIEDSESRKSVLKNNFNKSLDKSSMFY